MGRMKKPLDITGTVGNISIYKVRGSDEPIARTKGGPTKRMVKTRKSFATTRRNNMEFGGRARMTSQVMDMLRPMKYVGDYNLAGPLNSLFIPIQALDTVSEHGERKILLTKNPGLLEGFNLNRRTHFNTLLTHTPDYTLSKEKVTATITIPELIPGVNFFPPETFSWYKFIAVLGVVEDLFYNPHGYRTASGNFFSPGFNKQQESEWLNITPKNAAIKLTLSFGDFSKEMIQLVGKNNYSCLLAIGIAFGSMNRGEIAMVKYVGSGKILAMQ